MGYNYSKALWNLKVYGGKTTDGGISIPTKIVVSLAQSLLDSRRIRITDSYYTTLELANILLDRQTQLIGTLRANRQENRRKLHKKNFKTVTYVS